MSTDEPLSCERCGRQVGVSAAEYETFERMHYVCFHYEFEHDPVDPDQECEAGGCPSGALGGGRDTVTSTARRLSAEATGGPIWENDTLGTYLEAMAAWLDDCDGYYTDQHRVRPSNVWVIFNDALRAATRYE
jgi:hypothetical protein